MGYDIFVSYATQDKLFVDALVHGLEKENYRCWYAPRDIAAGVSWPAAITQAIRQTPAMLLVFSASSNNSEEISRELTLASSNKCMVIPVRTENITPNAELEYHLSNRHWLDVYDLETEGAVKRVLDGLKRYSDLFDRAKAAENEPAGLNAKSSEAEKSLAAGTGNAGSETAGQPAPGAHHAAQASPPAAPRKRGKTAAALALLLLLATGGAYYLMQQPDEFPADPEAAQLAPYKVARVVKYVSVTGQPISIYAFALAPLKGGSVPYECMLAFSGIGGKMEGRVFRANRLIDPNVRYIANVNGEMQLLLTVNNQGGGEAVRPDTGKKVEIMYGSVFGGLEESEAMLRAYRERRPWKPGSGAASITVE